MPDRHVLITGGAGFIGSNLAHRLASEGAHVRILDSLARPGVERNAAWLKECFGERIDIIRSDIRDKETVARAVLGVSAVFHFAAQVAVTTSVADPRDDFEVNALGTLNLLEAVRLEAPDAAVVFASTNKVYGKMADVRFRQGTNMKYVPEQERLALHGFGEDRPLEFYSPYGCSKGSADQYVLDYARIYGLKTAVMRMSCIYGTRQYGTEDQGWVAHFAIRALKGEPITIYGDGHQVRDVLYVDDAVDAYVGAMRRIDDPKVKGHAFNLGGGVENAISLRELLEFLEEELSCRIPLQEGEWRPGDQVYYVSDTRKVREALGLRRPVPWRTGIRRLTEWLQKEGVAPRAVPA